MPDSAPSLPAQVAEKVTEKVVETPLVSHATDAVGDIATALAARIPYIALALGLFFLFFFGATWVRRLVFRVVSRDGRFLNTALLVARAAYSGILALGVLVGVTVAMPGFTPAQLVSALGFVSVALGFAFRDVLSIWLAGVIILLSEPYRIGDAVSFGGFEGRVEEIQTRATFIHTYDGRRVVVPNANLFTKELVVEVYTRRRVELKIGLAPDTDVRQAREILREALDNVPGLLEEPQPRVLVAGVEENKIVFQILFWIEAGEGHDLPAARDAAWEFVLDALQSANIERATWNAEFAKRNAE